MIMMTKLCSVYFFSIYFIFCVKLKLHLLIIHFRRPRFIDMNTTQETIEPDYEEILLLTKDAFHSVAN